MLIWVSSKLQFLSFSRVFSDLQDKSGLKTDTHEEVLKVPNTQAHSLNETIPKNHMSNPESNGKSQSTVDLSQSVTVTKSKEIMDDSVPNIKSGVTASGENMSVPVDIYMDNSSAKVNQEHSDKSKDESVIITGDNASSETNMDVDSSVLTDGETSLACKPRKDDNQTISEKDSNTNMTTPENVEATIGTNQAAEVIRLKPTLQEELSTGM